jgi:iron complex outermembrane receptor protein
MTKQISRMRQGLAGALLAGASFLALSAAQAAEVPADGATQLEELVVTARKRSESLQDVPASIVAVGARQIEALNAKDLRDLDRVTPNAHIAENGEITIRGIRSNTRNIGFEAGAAVYIDGVYQGRPAGNNQDLVDVERVEVLRGPQGTLYGKNTTAGAISLVTARPGGSITGKVEAQYGERDDRRLSGYVSGPLVDGLIGAKISAFRRKADGYETNLFNGEHYGAVDSWGARAELRLTPGPWDLALRGDISHDDSINFAPTPVAGFATAFVAGRDTVSEDARIDESVEDGGLSFTAERSFGDGYTFTSISAWRKLKQHLAGSDDYSPLDILSHDFVDHARHYTQEFRIASPAGDRLSYVVGAYGFWQKLGSFRPARLGQDFPIQGTLVDDAGVKTRTLALFGSADYRFTERLTANLGLRYTNEHKSLAFLQTGVAALGYPDLDLQDTLSDSDLSPAVSLTFEATPDVTLYAKVSRGFKSGGWNPDIAATPNIRFGPESLTNYEAGVRAQLFDRRMTLNVTAYVMKWKDMQVQQLLSTLEGLVITNAGKATIRGLEAELQARPAPWLSLSAGGALNDTEFDEFLSGTGDDYSGQHFLYTPKWSGYVAAEGRWPVGGFGDLVAQADYSAQSRVYFDNQRTVTAAGAYASGGYGILNARVGLAFSNGAELFVFGDNLTDKRVLVDRFSDGLGLGLTLDAYGPPRQYGVRLSYSF